MVTKGTLKSRGANARERRVDRHTSHENETYDVMPMMRTHGGRRERYRIRSDMIFASDLMTESLRARTPMSGARGPRVSEAHPVSESDLMSESL